MNSAPRSFDVLLGFDMETDVGSWTPFHEGLRHGTPRVLEVFRRHQATGTFYFVGLSAREVPESVRQVREDGHEIGAHSLYHETVGDAIFPIPGLHPLLSHEVRPRLELNTRWVEEIAGTRPVSFRCPRLFGSTAVCNALEELGYVSDASYPMYFYREQLAPYHPDAADWTRRGAMRLVQIPNFADLTIASTDTYGRDRDQWPKFRTESAEKLLAHVDNFLAHLEAQGVERRVLAFYFHPWEFHPMPQGVIHFGEGGVLPDPFITAHCGDRALEQLDLLLTGLQARGARFKTAAQIAAET
ncbi:MAG: polysaccharide deacetylase family protein [Chthoniobacterales bacterium]|nr:polysaccharide deacetylase family protein [Chthoniobacterales bacterium]